MDYGEDWLTVLDTLSNTLGHSFEHEPFLPLYQLGHQSMPCVKLKSALKKVVSPGLYAVSGNHHVSFCPTIVDGYSAIVDSYNHALAVYDRANHGEPFADIIVGAIIVEDSNSGESQAMVLDTLLECGMIHHAKLSLCRVRQEDITTSLQQNSLTNLHMIATDTDSFGTVEDNSNIALIVVPTARVAVVEESLEWMASLRHENPIPNDYDQPERMLTVDAWTTTVHQVSVDETGLLCGKDYGETLAFPFTGHIGVVPWENGEHLSDSFSARAASDDGSTSYRPSTLSVVSTHTHVLAHLRCVADQPVPSYLKSNDDALGVLVIPQHNLRCVAPMIDEDYGTSATVEIRSDYIGWSIGTPASLMVPMVASALSGILPFIQSSDLAFLRIVLVSNSVSAFPPWESTTSMNTCVQQPRSIGYQHQSPPTKAHECNMVELEGKSGDAPVLPSVADSSLLSEVSASRPDAPMTDAAASTEACMESVTDGYFASMLCDGAMGECATTTVSSAELESSHSVIAPSDRSADAACACDTTDGDVDNVAPTESLAMDGDDYTALEPTPLSLAGSKIADATKDGRAQPLFPSLHDLVARMDDEWRESVADLGMPTICDLSPSVASADNTCDSDEVEDDDIALLFPAIYHAALGMEREWPTMLMGIISPDQDEIRSETKGSDCVSLNSCHPVGRGSESPPLCRDNERFVPSRDNSLTAATFDLKEDSLGSTQQPNLVCCYKLMGSDPTCCSFEFREHQRFTFTRVDVKSLPFDRGPLQGPVVASADLMHLPFDRGPDWLMTCGQTQTPILCQVTEACSDCNADFAHSAPPTGGTITLCPNCGNQCYGCGTFARSGVYMFTHQARDYESMGSDSFYTAFGVIGRL